ncbi:MAG: hypothetical protein RIC93_02055 [Alphaproteobacteria bacterium]
MIFEIIPLRHVTGCGRVWGTMPDLPSATIAVPLGFAISAWRWLARVFMPKPVFSRDVKKSQWVGANNGTQWAVSLSVRTGVLFWKNKIENCRLYLIRGDWGPSGEPEGIWLKWIKNGQPIDDLKVTLDANDSYEAVVVVRDETEASAYIANERFIDTLGAEKKWELKPGRPCGINDPVGRYTFWLEVRSGQRRRWRSEHYYIVTVPPLGTNGGQFVLSTKIPHEE